MSEPVAFNWVLRTLGILDARISRSIPPPVAVTMPRARHGAQLNISFDPITTPVTAKAPVPIASAACITEFLIDILSGNSVIANPVEANATINFKFPRLRSEINSYMNTCVAKAEI